MYMLASHQRCSERAKLATEAADHRFSNTTFDKTGFQHSSSAAHFFRSFPKGFKLHLLLYNLFL